MLAVSAYVGVATGQERPGGGGRRWGGGFDREQMRQRMAQRLKEALGASDEEWTVIGPLLERVQTLSREARGGMASRFGRGGRFGGPRGRPGEPGAEREPSAVEKAAAELRAALEDQSTAAAQVKTKLTAYREAREQAREKLAKAQAELREVLTLRQEAQLVLMGMLG